MPELPEVETTRRGLQPWLVGATIAGLTVRDSRLRWPLAPDLEAALKNRKILSLQRRGKYLLLELDDGWLMIHLGMSGSLRYLSQFEPVRPHDHVDIELADGGVVRYNDPRRFGSMHFTAAPERHPLLAALGPEPLEPAFDGAYLHARCRGRHTAIKSLIMNGAVVVGVGNIYANEALFRAGIHPLRPAGRISRQRCEALASAIRAVLEDALRSGGTTLRDFVGGDGKPGYFRQSLAVYERAGQECHRCRAAIRRRIIGQRASYYCPRCQR